MRLKFSIVFTALLALALSAGTADAQKRGGVLKFATPSVKPGLDPARTRTGDAYMLTEYDLQQSDAHQPRIKARTPAGAQMGSQRG